MYAWIIDTDHLAEPGDEPGTNMNAAGVVGPREAPDALCDVLRSRKYGEASNAGVSFFKFTMRDDDGELYYSGRLAVDADSEPGDEDVCGAPLYDYGQPNAGCTSITYRGHPSMDCG